ncbi:MAG: S8/S53 family peptidase [archaeon]|nr:S8/S53 family peptidase [archaeon]
MKFKNRSRCAPITISFIFALLCLAPISGLANPIGDLGKIDPYLLLSFESNEDDSFEVIYQFEPHYSARGDEFAHLEVEHLGDAPLINGGLILATEDSIRAISTWSEIKYLELNRPLEFFYLPPSFGGQEGIDSGIMMHETTHVVNATTTWSRGIIQPDGTIAFDTDYAFTEWDGDGTAIVDLDTGVDAGHPDYDYLGPWTGEKTIYSAKWNGVWSETTNSDTSSGHGTHVGGTIAGNGDASAGRRAGVAKGAQLVALGTGDGASIFAAEQGLEWTFMHSIPGQNEFHIRVVSNSWGTDGDYNPQGAIATITDRLVFENGVAVIFAASNSGGSGDECSGGLRTNVYANTPSAISVAAMTHDGSQITSFSSRGCKLQQHTWPDVGAPGRNIWATAPRGTVIDALTKVQGQNDLYYMSISGTSMATPHVGGMAGIILDVAPSLGVANYHREDHDEGSSLVGGDGTASYGQYSDWESADYSRVHELELILELTAQYDTRQNACEDGNDEDSCNDIPTECYLSKTGQCHDWRIGHGLTNVDAAVGLARTLQLMRDQNHDGIVDHPEYTVWDAFEIYDSIFSTKEIPLETNRLRHEWKGDWNHFNNGNSGTGIFSTDDRHYVWIPNGTATLLAQFTPTEVDIDTAQIGSLQLEIDLGSDGSNDAQGQGSRVSDSWIYDLDVSSEYWNTWVEFDVSGQAMTFLGFIEDAEFFESSIPYTVDVVLTLDLSNPVNVEIPQKPDYYSDLDPTTPSDAWDDSYSGHLIYIRQVYDQPAVIERIQPLSSETTDSESFFSALGNLLSEHTFASFFSFLLLITILLGVAFLNQKIRTEEPGRLNLDILEGELQDDSFN